MLSLRVQNALLVGFTITLLDVTDIDQGTNAQLTYVVLTPVRDTKHIIEYKHILFMHSFLT